jgi:hypothetical protein
MFEHLHLKVRKVERFDAGVLWTLDICAAVHKVSFMLLFWFWWRVRKRFVFVIDFFFIIDLLL